MVYFGIPDGLCDSTNHAKRFLVSYLKMGALHIVGSALDVRNYSWYVIPDCFYDENDKKLKKFPIIQIQQID